MKKLLLFITATASIALHSKAQNVGINVPAPAESLHVDSTIKVGKNATINAATPDRKNRVKFGDGDYVTIGEELLDDKMYIRFGDLVLLKSSGSARDGYIGIGTETPSAALDVDGSLRFRTGAAAGRVLTSDANGNATWQAPGGGGGFTLPYAGSDASGGTSFIIANTNGAANAITGQSFGSGVGVTGFTSSGKGLYGSANGGTGIEAFSNTGTAGLFTSSSGLAIKTSGGNVEVNGKIKMIDGTQAAGKVLTSDAAGLASWQNLPAAPASVDFSGRRLLNAITIPHNTTVTITGLDNISQSGGSNYNSATGVYTIPVAGYYQINASVQWNPMPAANVNIIIAANTVTPLAQAYQVSNPAFGVSTTLSCGRRFTAGETVSVRAYQSSGTTTQLFSPYDGQSFSIALVHP